jgi:hypothetical protein
MAHERSAPADVGRAMPNDGQGWRNSLLSSSLFLLAVVSLLLVGLHPFTYSSLATSFDGLLHLYRLVELDHLLSQGVWFPRWAPDFIFGFGYPIFNYYAPLAYYLSAPLHWLGLTFTDSATVFFFACTFGAALSMYALAASLLGRNWQAALVAALSYVYAPTHIYDNFYRSAWSTVLAYAVAPFALWALWRWYENRRVRELVFLAAGVAALMLAHNVSALITMPVVALATLAFLAAQTSPTNSQGLTFASRFGLAWLAILAGLALSAFFWLPAVVETQYVQTWRLTIPPDFDFHTHFLTLTDWFAWPAPAEIGRINPDLVNTMGPIQFALALSGILAVLVVRPRGRGWRAISFFCSIVLSASLFMTLPLSTWLWEHVALLPSLQFPHRLLGIAALAASLLGAQLVAVLPERATRPVSMALCALLVLSSIPFLYPRPQPPVSPNPSLGDMLAHEHNTGALGTTASGEYFPIWVQFIPRASTFEEPIVNGENPQRFDSRSLPAGAKQLSQTAGPLAFTLQVDSPTPYRATFRSFYFPGWQGYVDGQAVETTPNQGQGFSTFPVPAGNHTIALVFGSTPIRDVAIFVSLTTLTLGFVWVVLRAWLFRHGTRSREVRLASLTATTQSGAYSPYILLGTLLFVFKAGISDRIDTPLRVAFDGLRVPTVQYARSISLGESVTWLGYDLARDTLLPSESLDLTLYWEAQHDLNTVYSSFAHLVDERANLYAQKDNLHPGGAPTTTWRVQEFDVDRHSLQIPAGTPPGDYWIELGMYDPRSGVRLQRDSVQTGEPLDRILVGPIRIRKPAEPPSISALQIRQPSNLQWPSGLRLLGFTAERDKLPADDFLRIALYWRAENTPLPERRMSLRLINPQSGGVIEQHSAPSNDRYPTGLWSAGEIVRDNRALFVPRSLSEGDYHLQLQVDGDSDWKELATFKK